jgi:ribonuclease HI
MQLTFPEEKPEPTVYVARKIYKIEFDGGTPCNVPRLGYGIGYGSYRINEGHVVRCDHKVPMSANAAEIFTLIEAVRYIGILEPNRALVELNIWGDSQIAIKWANGCTPSGKPAKLSKGTSDLFRNAVQTLRDCLRGYGSVHAHWHSRINSVSTFGH